MDLAERAATRLVALHLLVDRVEVLRAARHLGLDAVSGEGALQLVDELLHVPLSLAALLGDHRGHTAVVLRLQVAEGEVFQLPLELPHTEA